MNAPFAQQFIEIANSLLIDTKIFRHHVGQRSIDAFERGKVLRKTDFDRSGTQYEIRRRTSCRVSIRTQLE